jgi:hypothetical protein
MGSRLVRAVAALVILGIVVWIGKDRVQYAFQVGNDVSPIPCAYSESGSLRAGEGYATYGFLKNAGLPNTVFGNRFPELGMKAEVPGESTFIYTHYPPLPDWIAGLLTLGLGLDRIPTFRLLPIGMGLASILFLAACLWVTLGPVRTVLALMLFTWPPIFTNVMHTLSYMQYAFALLLVQLGVLLLVFAGLGPRRSVALAVLGGLGFLQGWLSFDYVFLVPLCAIPCWLLLYGRGAAGAREPLLWYVLVPAAGFGCAHLLHFFEVAAYHGSMSAALNDFLNIAKLRRHGALPVHPVFANQKKDLVSVGKLYCWALSTPVYFNFSFPWFVTLTGLALTVKDVRIWFPQGIPFRLTWTGTRGNAVVLLTALVISGLWAGLMRQHAICHTHYIPRHFFLFYFCCVLVLLRSLGVDMVRTESASARRSISSSVL